MNFKRRVIDESMPIYRNKINEIQFEWRLTKVNFIELPFSLF